MEQIILSKQDFLKEYLLSIKKRSRFGKSERQEDQRHLSKGGMGRWGKSRKAEGEGRSGRVRLSTNLEPHKPTTR